MSESPGTFRCNQFPVAVAIGRGTAFCIQDHGIPNLITEFAFQDGEKTSTVGGGGLGELVPHDFREGGHEVGEANH